MLASGVWPSSSRPVSLAGGRRVATAIIGRHGSAPVTFLTPPAGPLPVSFAMDQQWGFVPTGQFAGQRGASSSWRGFDLRDPPLQNLAEAGPNSCSAGSRRLTQGCELLTQPVRAAFWLMSALRGHPIKSIGLPTVRSKPQRKRPFPWCQEQDGVTRCVPARRCDDSGGRISLHVEGNS